MDIGVYFLKLRWIVYDYIDFTDMDIVLETLFHEESGDSSNEVLWFQLSVLIFEKVFAMQAVEVLSTCFDIKLQSFLTCINTSN